jgi:hypothetical protein
MAEHRAPRVCSLAEVALASCALHAGADAASMLVGGLAHVDAACRTLPCDGRGGLGPSSSARGRPVGGSLCWGQRADEAPTEPLRLGHVPALSDCCPDAELRCTLGPSRTKAQAKERSRIASARRSGRRERRGPAWRMRKAPRFDALSRLCSARPRWWLATTNAFDSCDEHKRGRRGTAGLLPSWLLLRQTSPSAAPNESEAQVSVRAAWPSTACAQAGQASELDLERSICELAHVEIAPERGSTRDALHPET